MGGEPCSQTGPLTEWRGTFDDQTARNYLSSELKPVGYRPDSNKKLFKPTRA